MRVKCAHVFLAVSFGFALAFFQVLWQLSTAFPHVERAPSGTLDPLTGPKWTCDDTESTCVRDESETLRSASSMKLCHLAGRCGAFIIVAISSAPSHFAERDACRRTWFNFAANIRERIVFRFFTARADDDIVNRQLEDEKSTWHDVVQFDYIDSYKKLSLKTKKILTWSLKQEYTFAFLFKTDDDTFVRVDRLSLQLKQAQRADERCNSALYWGFFNIEAYRIKNTTHKWFDDVYDADIYPPYALGTGYALSRAVVQRLVKRDVHRAPLKLFPMEDAGTGIWMLDVAPVCRVEALWDVIPFVQSGAFSVEQVARCEETMVLRSHCHHVSEFYRLFANYMQCARMCECCEETPKRKWANRWAVRKERKKWYADKREERRRLEEDIYSDIYQRLGSVIPALPIEDPDWLLNHTLLSQPGLYY